MTIVTTVRLSSGPCSKAEQLLFNWQLGRDLVLRRAEERWGSGIVEQVSLDLKSEFPGVKGFSARNLWDMKRWYLFYAEDDQSGWLLEEMEESLELGGSKLRQVAACQPRRNRW